MFMNIFYNERIKVWVQHETRNRKQKSDFAPMGYLMLSASHPAGF